MTLAGIGTGPLILAAALGYLLGAVPFGLVLCRLAGYGDIRKIGSGNIGATNVLRTGSKPLALATLILDSGKGAAAALAAGLLINPIAGVIAAVAAVIGHNFPVWLGFKGGKGVATTLGTLIAIAWPVGLACCLTWLAMAALFRISSLAALISLGLSPIYALYLIPMLAGTDDMPRIAIAIAALFLALLAWARHGANIRRILKGEEPRIGASKKN